MLVAARQKRNGNLENHFFQPWMKESVRGLRILHTKKLKVKKARLPLAGRPLLVEKLGEVTEQAMRPLAKMHMRAVEEDEATRRGMASE